MFFFNEESAIYNEGLRIAGYKEKVYSRSESSKPEKEKKEKLDPFPPSLE